MFDCFRRLRRHILPYARLFVISIAHMLTTPGGIPPSTHALGYQVISRITKLCGAAMWGFVDEFFVKKLLVDIAPPKMGMYTKQQQQTINLFS